MRYFISQTPQGGGVTDDIEFSKEVATLLYGYIVHIKSYNGYNTVVNFSKLGKIINYLEKYPLKKLISYPLPYPKCLGGIRGEE